MNNTHHLLISIAAKLHGIDVSSLSTAEDEIAKILIGEHYLVVDQHGDLIVPKPLFSLYRQSLTK